MKVFNSVNWFLFASVWYFANGVLHDIFIIKDHQGGYNRELLNLLLTGHILMLSGAIMFFSYLMILNKIQCGILISSVVAIGMIIYCAMIFPFLKSMGTLLISIIILFVGFKIYPTLPDIYEIMQDYREVK